MPDKPKPKTRAPSKDVPAQHSPPRSLRLDPMAAKKLDAFAMAALTGGLNGKNVPAMTVHQMTQIAEACYTIAEVMAEESERRG